MGREILDLLAPRADLRLSYGAGPLHFGDLRLPNGDGPHPLAISIHGGFWRNKFTLDYMGHPCAALARAGIATWNIEFRRVGDAGGGWPGTLEDVAAATEYVAELSRRFPLKTDRLIAFGHSAGGHLALWLAAAGRKVQGAVSLGGVADLRRAWKLDLGRGAVSDFLGGDPAGFDDRYADASPFDRLPFGLPQRLVHGTEDEIVPLEIARGYAEKARAAGDDALLIPLEGAGHFEVIDPRAREFSVVEKTILDLYSAQ